ncbi:thiamine-phosphate kinase [filamentous cyanobacterium LEGE 11480]|uniref:Thiamine-monophosphate kinase n=1 Tax=Romeriopsis navalis LEGE 11480 TaxID=2777977 RepID=A0A928VU62_9CYAN|nr:thiamine-phosphate kinase [Romeriopsis navalis]MBE9032294.1 thiamine-phosphate kinase [Romeriopsis navalis LEGE 11480]
MTQTIAQLGEQGLLKLVQSFCPTEIVGDDAAVLATQPGASIVVTTDVLVDSVHFSDQTTPPHSAGWRAIAANLSDLAAMGAMPTGITVGLGLPPDTPVPWVESLYQGMSDCLSQFGGAIVGGDVVRSPVRTIAITAFGQVSPANVIQRSAAKVGDVILVTGPHGLSRAGLECLLKADTTLPDAGTWRKAHQYPQPRFDVSGQCRNFRVAGMDSSDGFADAVLQICRSSQVGATITHLPIPVTLLNHPQATDWTLYGGEDFELVLCLAPGQAQQLLTQFPGAMIVGQIIAGSQVQVATPNAAVITLSLDAGFRHFAS